MATKINKYNSTKAYDTPLYTEPTSVDEIFSVKAIRPSGMFALNNDKYSKLYIITDINYDGVTEEEQGDIILNYAAILKSLSSYRFSYTVANEVMDKEEFVKKTSIPLKGDGKDSLRKEYSNVIANKLFSNKKGLVQTIYLTVTVEAKNVEEAELAFKNLEFDLNKSFKSVSKKGIDGSDVIPVDINTRMQLWYNFTHLYTNNKHVYDYDEEISYGRDFINTVAPDKIDFNNKYFVINDNVYGSVMAIEKYPKSLESNIMSKLTALDCVNYITINAEPIDKEALRSELIKKQNLVTMRVDKEKSELRKRNDFLSEISKSTQALQNSLYSLADELREKDEKYFNTTILIMVLCDSHDKLKEITTSIEKIENEFSFKIKPLVCMQREGINSAYPFGIQEIKRCCNLSSVCLSMFTPYKAQNINDDGGIWYGINGLSQNPIIINRKLYKNFNGIVTGMAGAGKSALVKGEILLNLLNNPDDQRLIIDPQNEFIKLAEAVGGTVIRFEPGKNVFINPLDVDFEDVDYAGLQKIIKQKADFVLTIISCYLERPLDKAETSVIDRVINKIYAQNYANRNNLNGANTSKQDIDVPQFLKNESVFKSNGTKLSNEEQIKQYSPLLQDIYEELNNQHDPVASQLATSMDIFINGSLNLFNHRTNVDLNNKTTVFAFGDDLKTLRLTAMTVTFEIIREKIRKNFINNVWSYVYIDEMHEALSHRKVAEMIVRMWKEERKNHGVLTGITQNLAELIDSTEVADTNLIRNIFANTQLFVLASQSETDIQVIEEYLPMINPVLLNYVRNVEPGTGLIMLGNVCVPFDNIMDRNNAIYHIIETSSFNR